MWNAKFKQKPKLTKEDVLSAIIEVIKPIEEIKLLTIYKKTFEHLYAKIHNADEVFDINTLKDEI